ncbi:MAG: cytotoxic translational repressor of toxin-antitoxin stability system [Symplocastrum torsivum CPER-KK1]|uniref:Cytotoxic translational repressor of toxin-antitoxin stability system n=1 Tax=Symplocastrum torsivum CPER-KK1 TaxID=450513 RepID=A0A951PL93_9CYAN|nr:cytotoxic translational repressor of toxin-antitoxin stability system [Microcoleus sp. FACHB-SPT15]MBD1806285.1 cytotoxic translational repressor of toxin-antitoxin stability system [Microcoleus sp. FACHB-SPT15]MBW4546025.1 cytotoxic translational repressor of toxin-antitoxin stability system [Symplocastrum torsivum CPER-KK1]
MRIEVRYAQSFLRDLRNLESAAYQQVCQVVFDEFLVLNQIQDLPGLKRISSNTIFYRFNVDNYMVGIEVTGQIVKFLRVLPKPYI